MIQKIKLHKLILVNLILIVLFRYLPTNKIITEEIATEEVAIVTTEEIAEVKEEEPQVTSRGSIERQTTQTEEIIEEDKTLQGYRVTSYYPGDNCATSSKTGSGKTTNDFSTMLIDEKQVYTYQGRIVVAGATKELLKSGYDKNGSQEAQNKHYFNYYDTGRIKINGNWYGFIVLDSCGASMWKGYYRLDIFVPNSNNVIDTRNIEIVYD